MEPDLSKCVQNGDFGKYSFYTTPNEYLAVKRAQKKSHLNSNGKTTVTEYICDVGGLRILQYDKPDIDWILAIVDGRSGFTPFDVDLIIAPIADGDNIAFAIREFSAIRQRKEKESNLFERANYSDQYKKLLEEDLLRLLSEVKTVEDAKQYVFCTTKALERLETKGYKEYNNQNHVIHKGTLSKKNLTIDEVKPEKFLIKRKAPSKKIVKKALYKTRGLSHER